MRHITTFATRRTASSSRVNLSRAVAGAAIILGASGLIAAPAFAAGTTSDTISASAPPHAGSTHGSYSPSASATSGDTVAITLDKSSTGCSLSDGKVTFTGAGTCVIDFNDPGNSTYAAAQVQQSITVYSSNTITTSAFPKDASNGGAYAPGLSATSGDKVVMTLDKDSGGCYLNYGWIEFKGSGECIIDLNDPGNGAFAAASQVKRWIKVYGSNTISVSTPPAAGTIHETYTPSGSATSGDKVSIKLSSQSTGCSVSSGVVTFNDNGVCVIDFNDAGNGAFAAAPEVQQSITIGSGNPKSQGALDIVTTSMIYGHPLSLTTSGGSGAGAISYAVTTVGTADCQVQGNVLTSSKAGTCVVVATKAADGTYAQATSLATTITILAPAPKATRLDRSLLVGRTMNAVVVGSGFYGRPLVASSLVGTSAVVIHDNGRDLTLHVIVDRGSHPGIYRFTIVFAHGQRTVVRYRLR